MTKDHPDKNRMQILAGRGKFNEVLNHWVAENCFNHALVIRSLTQETHFMELGDVSATSQFVFWKEIDHMVKKFDCHKLISSQPGTEVVIMMTVTSVLRIKHFCQIGNRKST